MPKRNRKPLFPNEQAMPFNEPLAQRVRDILGEECPTRERQMFGGLAFTVNGHLCCGIVGEDLVVRVGGDGYAQALSQPHARPMNFTGREMKGFLYIGPAGRRTALGLREWIKRSLSFVTSLRPK